MRGINLLEYRTQFKDTRVLTWKPTRREAEKFLDRFGMKEVK